MYVYDAWLFDILCEINDCIRNAEGGEGRVEANNLLFFPCKDGFGEIIEGSIETVINIVCLFVCFHFRILVI